jgi:hypothetical protein
MMRWFWKGVLMRWAGMAPLRSQVLADVVSSHSSRTRGCYKRIRTMVLHIDSGMPPNCNESHRAIRHPTVIPWALWLDWLASSARVTGQNNWQIQGWSISN